MWLTKKVQNCWETDGLESVLEVDILSQWFISRVLTPALKHSISGGIIEPAAPITCQLRSWALIISCLSWCMVSRGVKHQQQMGHYICGKVSGFFLLLIKSKLMKYKLLQRTHCTQSCNPCNYVVKTVRYPHSDIFHPVISSEDVNPIIIFEMWPCKIAFPLKC